jgi:UDP-glucuronate decarboxylase
MHPNDGRVVSNFIVQALKSDPSTIFGDGMQMRSFCYVEDLVNGSFGLWKIRDRLLGWEPRCQLEEGLRRTIAYFKGLTD